jgi:hypothetical protein
LYLFIIRKWQAVLLVEEQEITCQNNYIYSDFSKEVIIYIAGFVVYELSSVLRCEPCLTALCAINKNDFLNSMITLK